MTVGVITNASKDAALSYTGEVAAFLQARGVNVSVEPVEPSPDADFWVVLGGDGTMLRASHKAVTRRIPLLGINFGGMGFLTDVDRNEGLTAIDKALQGRYKREERLMLEAVAPGGAWHGQAQSDHLALNDVYISRGPAEKLIQLDVYVNGQYMDTLRADGVLVSTPTGSTAYNLSAGGPILLPEGAMTVITAVCPHSLYTRPWVVEARDEVSIVPRQPAAVSIDGETRPTLAPGEKLTIRRFPLNAVILKTSGLHFYEVLRKKMQA